MFVSFASCLYEPFLPQRCLKDLRERFAQVDIQASKPIVPFRETAVKGTGNQHAHFVVYLLKVATDMTPPKNPNSLRGTMHGSSSLNIVRFTVRASPLPRSILDFVLENISILKKLQDDRKARISQPSHDKAIIEEAINADVHMDIVRRPTVSPEQFWGALQKICDEVGGEWEGIVERIWAFGPQRAGGCLLIDARKSITTSSVIFLCFRSDDDN